MGWSIEFYEDRRGRVPVRDFFESLEKGDLARIQRDLDLLTEFGISLRAPHVKHVQGKIWELRTKSRGQNFRVLYFTYLGQRIILLHVLLKKTARVPRDDLALAEKRLKSFLDQEKR